MASRREELIGTPGMRTPLLTLSSCLWLLIVPCGICAPRVEADESLDRYFEQLRRRGLYSLAEGYAISRLAQSNVPLALRTDLSIELSRTLAEHAGFVSDEQQAELWKKAQSAVDDERSRDPGNSREILLAVQSAIVPAVEAEWLRVECEVRPFDEPLAARARHACLSAIELLRAVERRLSEPSRDVSVNKRPQEEGPSSHELRVQLHRVRFELGQSLRNRAELSAAGSRERSADLVEAEQTLRKLIGVADEPLLFRAKLGLAACSRLKGEVERAHEMLTALEKTEPRPDDELLDEVEAERARLLLDRRRAADAAELIVQTRSKRQRLTGELWFLQIRALAAMRDVAVQRKDATLADRLREQTEIMLQRCDEQVGGYWSRRCRMLWESTRTAEKYGPALDAAMQQARADFLAGRIEASLKGYAGAERSALEAGQTDIAIELGYTRASILLHEKQFEASATEFLRLARDYPKHPRTASAHLNGAYCLGRLYEERRTQSRREAYTDALDRHLELFAGDVTADDARFFKAQLEEQRLQARAALLLYLQVGADHSRAAEAHAGAARCYEVILVRMRERKLATDEFEREAIGKLTQFIESHDAATGAWTAPQAEVALHLGAILMMSDPPRFDRAEPLLATASENAARVSSDDEQSKRWKRLRSRVEALRVVALAGSGRPLEAERRVNALAAASPRDLLAIVERLAPFVASDDRQRRVQYVELQLRAAERLNEQRDALSKAEQEQLDRCLGRAYLTSGQLTKAVELYRRQADAGAKDAARQREIALQLEDVDQRECVVLARQCWRRAEALTKPGTTDWLLARLGVIVTTAKLDQVGEARALLEVTKVLYPEVVGGELKDRFAEIERQLGPNSTNAKPRD